MQHDIRSFEWKFSGGTTLSRDAESILAGVKSAASVPTKK
jgi:hypothetical protein